MSTHYNTEPPPTASATLHTTSGHIQVSLFATQAPLACRSFLQHALDSYYNNTIFHRIVPGFIIQGGDRSGTGEGGASIYEEKEFERGVDGEKIIFKDEVHSRLKFNRRGLLGMAKTEEGAGAGGYGSQFFITLGNCEQELNGKCTLFGRVEGGSIYAVVGIGEGEVVEGTDRPVWPVRVERVEVGEMGPLEGLLIRNRMKHVVSRKDHDEGGRKKAKRKKTGKALLSFGAEEEDVADDLPVVKKKAKFNTSLVSGGDEMDPNPKPRSNGNGSSPMDKSSPPSQRPPKPSKPAPASSSGYQHHSSSSPSASPKALRRPSVPDPESQFPIRDPEVPSHSPSPSPALEESALSKTNTQIAALKASMRRNVPLAPAESNKKKSALEQLLPETSIRGRKRRHPGDTNGFGGGGEKDSESLKILNAFKAKLAEADAPDSNTRSSVTRTNGPLISKGKTTALSDPRAEVEGGGEDEEAILCDLHFIANCQSCQNWDDNLAEGGGRLEDDDNNDREWMSHALSFEKDRLGKDLTWKRKNEEELVVIDPREKGKEIKEKKKKEWDERGARRVVG